MLTLDFIADLAFFTLRFLLEIGLFVVDLYQKNLTFDNGWKT